MRRIVPLVFALGAASLVAAEPAASGPAGATAPATKPVKSAAPAKPVAPVSSEYELRGFFGTGDELEVSVRRTGETQSRWLRVGVKAGDVLVEKADAQTGTATIVTGGRHFTLRLASASAPTAREPEPVAVEEEKKPTPEEARATRKARFGAMMKNMTPEQTEAAGKIMREKMPELQKANPELFKGPPENDEARQKMNSLFVPVIHEAAQAAFNLPDKEGKIAPLPADFDTLLTESMNDANRAQPQQPAPAEGAGTPAATTPVP